jgi:hypothetical protein
MILPKSNSSGMRAAQHRRGQSRRSECSRVQRGFAWLSRSQPAGQERLRAFCEPCAGIGASFCGRASQRGLRDMLPNKSFERTSLLSSRFALGQRAAQLRR